MQLKEEIKTAIEYYNSPNEISDKKLKKAIHNLKYFKCIIKDNLNYTKYNMFLQENYFTLVLSLLILFLLK